MKNIYSDFSKLRISYNVYKAVYAIAHAIKSMMSCKKDAGPFPLKACPDATNIQPWQVGYCTDSHGILLVYHFDELMVTRWFSLASSLP
jgi:hypothetical protein